MHSHRSFGGRPSTHAPRSRRLAAVRGARVAPRLVLLLAHLLNHNVFIHIHVRHPAQSLAGRRQNPVANNNEKQKKKRNEKKVFCNNNKRNFLINQLKELFNAQRNVTGHFLLFSLFLIKIEK
jgi:hypothetical protein